MRSFSFPFVPGCSHLGVFLHVKLANNLNIETIEAMAKISFKLDKRRMLLQGKYPLRIAVSNQGKTAYINTGRCYTEEEWKKEKPFLEGQRGAVTGARNVLIRQKLTLEEKLLKLGYSGVNIEGLEACALRNLLTDKASETDPARFTLNEDMNDDYFLPYYRARMQEKDAQGTKMVYRRTLRLIERFQQDKSRDPERLTFADITPAWLLEFENWMKPTNGENSRSINLRNIRSVFNSAVEDGMKVTYPFSHTSSKRKGERNDGRRKFRIAPGTPSRHRNLTLEQLRAIKDFPVPPHQEKYRDLFLLMVYLIGINAADLLTARPSQLQRGRLDYKRKKTHAWYSIKVEPEAMEIINKYKGKKYLLDPCDRYKDYRDFLRRMNEQLKQIGISFDTRQSKHGKAICGELTSYWARHTWASIAVNNGIMQYTAARGLGHSWAKDKVTDIYINLDERVVDEANRKVIDLVNENQDVQ